MGTRDRDSLAIEDLRRYGASLVDSVPANRADSVAMRAIARRGRHRRSPRLVVVLATIGLLLVSNVALASVSDGAAPGDFLYPLDRGYEWALDRFGPADRSLERLSESAVLAERGDTDEAIKLLRTELATPSSDNDLIAAAIEELETRVQRGKEDQGNGNQSGIPVPSTPAATAPGQVDDEGGGPDPDSPSATAPGRIKDDEGGDDPGIDPPGQTKDDGAEAKDYREADPPGQKKDKPEAPPPASNLANGNSGNGNNGS